MPARAMTKASKAMVQRNLGTSEGRRHHPVARSKWTPRPSAVPSGLGPLCRLGYHPLLRLGAGDLHHRWVLLRYDQRRAVGPAPTHSGLHPVAGHDEGVP